MSKYYPIWWDQVIFDSAGNVNSGGWINAFYAGGSVPAPTYNDNDEANPVNVVIASDGRVQLKLDSAITYDLKIYASSGELIRTRENVVSGVGDIASIRVGTGLDIDQTDPENPIISANLNVHETYLPRSDADGSLSDSTWREDDRGNRIDGPSSFTSTELGGIGVTNNLILGNSTGSIIGTSSRNLIKGENISLNGCSDSVLIGDDITVTNGNNKVVIGGGNTLDSTSAPIVIGPNLDSSQNAVHIGNGNHEYLRLHGKLIDSIGNIAEFRKSIGFDDDGEIRLSYDIDTQSVKFDTSAGISVSTGQLAWNDVDKTMDLGLYYNSVLQIGQEFIAIVHNESGADIPDGKIVCVDGGASIDGMLHIATSSNDSESAFCSIAVTTGAIANGEYGYVTILGRVRGLDTSLFSEGEKLYLGLNGSIINTQPAFPLHSIEIGYCIVSDATNGIIFVKIDSQYAVEDLYNVTITSPQKGDSFIYEDNQWINRNFGSITKESTGFADPEGITVTYDQSTRKITLTGANISAYWRSNSTPLTGTTWTSDAHSAAPTGPLFLYYNGTAFVWSSTPWTFSDILIAFVSYNSSGIFELAIRECHGTMQWQTHREFHQRIGCYVNSGGDLSSYTLLSTTAANRRPDISATHLYDEDLLTINTARTSKTYTTVSLSGSGIREYTDDYTEIVHVLGTRPYYNYYDGANWSEVLMSNNYYANVYVMAIPSASDTISQKRRYQFIAPQTEFSTSASAIANTINSVNLGELNSLTPEFNFIAKIIIQYTAGDWSIYRIDKLTGTKVNQVSIGSTFLSTVSTDGITVTGIGTPGDPVALLGIGYRTVVDSNGKTWYITENPRDNTVDMVGYDINIPYAASATDLSATVNFPEVVSPYTAVDVSATPTLYNVVSTSWRKGGQTIDSITGTSCRVVLHGANDFLDTSDYARATIRVKFYI